MSAAHAVRKVLRPVRALFRSKHDAEMQHWRNIHREHGGFLNDWYRTLMLGMARESGDSFIAGKVVADFGCGPCGSLAWAKRAAAAIGIDVLVPQYFAAFPRDMRAHGMTYLTSTERDIPLPARSVDVMFTINALDHAANLAAMCDEICRVLKPGGRLCGTFNLNEPATSTEPQCLTEELLDRVLLGRFDCRWQRFGTYEDDDLDHYHEIFDDGPSSYRPGLRGYMCFDGTLRG